MADPWRSAGLPELVAAFAARPRHGHLRALLVEMLRSGFGIPYAEMAQEVYLAEGRGRIDILFGATVIELKSDLRREMADVQARLPAYMADAAQRTGRALIGLATDGATFIAFEQHGAGIAELARYETDAERPGELMARLEPLLSDRADLPPEPRAVAHGPGGGAQARPVGRPAARGLRRVGRRGLAVPAAHLPHGRGQGGRCRRAGRGHRRPGGPAHRARPDRRGHPRRRGGGLLRLRAARPGGRGAGPPHRPRGRPLPLARRGGTQATPRPCALAHARVPWLTARVLAGASPYRARFRAGATLYPRRFFIVDLERAGRLGVRLDAPRVRGHVGSLDKHPWVGVEPPHGPVEKQFLRSVLLGYDAG